MVQRLVGPGRRILPSLGRRVGSRLPGDGIGRERQAMTMSDTRGSGSSAVQVTREVEPARQIELLRVMQRIRRFEERAEELYLGGELPGFIHLSIGQEACAAGACLALRQDDFITSTHRGHGHCLAKGAPMDRMMAELYAKAFMATQ
jgi:TPP-dependent pyruvate/acetoin dehydrogenase alpha subunit